MKIFGYPTNPEEMIFYGKLLSMLIILPITLAASIVLFRKDRSSAALMLSIGTVLVVSLSIFKDLFFCWITDWWLSISESNSKWQAYLFLHSMVYFVQCLAGITAAFGGLFIVNRYRPPKNRPG